MPQNTRRKIMNHPRIMSAIFINLLVLSAHGEKRTAQKEDPGSLYARVFGYFTYKPPIHCLLQVE